MTREEIVAKIEESKQKIAEMGGFDVIVDNLITERSFSDEDIIKSAKLSHKDFVKFVMQNADFSKDKDFEKHMAIPEAKKFFDWMMRAFHNSLKRKAKTLQAA